MIQKDNNGDPSNFDLNAIYQGRRVFFANVEDKQGENCGMLMNLECVFAEEEPTPQQNIIKSARM